MLEAALMQAHPVGNDTGAVFRCGKPNFSVKFSKGEAIAEQGVSIDRLVCSVWMDIAQPKVELMMQLTLLGKLNTNALLCRKGIIYTQVDNCTFCSTNTKDIGHLLVTCSVSQDIWLMLASELGNAPTRQATLRQHYKSWISHKIRNKIRKKL